LLLIPIKPEKLRNMKDILGTAGHLYSTLRKVTHTKHITKGLLFTASYERRCKTASLLDRCN
jgi:hypothetical protein